MSQITRNLKPPNILVYCKCIEHFKKAEEKLLNVLQHNVYIVYHLKCSNLISPWKSNCAAVILLDSHPVKTTFMDYYNAGGKIFSFQTNFDDHLLSSCCTQVSNDEINKSSFISKSCMNGFTASFGAGSLYNKQSSDENSAAILLNNKSTILSRISLVDLPDEVLRDILQRGDLSTRTNLSEQSLERQSISTTFEMHVAPLNTVKRDSVLDKLKRSSKNGVYNDKIGLQIDFNNLASNGVSESRMILSDSSSSNFDLEAYSKARCHAMTLGSTVVYADVVSTTMNMLECIQNKLNEEIGLIAIAANQTQGIGRSGNKWLSPKGCAMFSFHARVYRQQDLAFLQHQVALAVVIAICNIPGYQNLDLKVKWPNDIYTESKIKVAGVLVKTSISGTTFDATIGIGINVDNERPSMCINEIIKSHNQKNNTDLSPLSVETVIGGTIREFERLLYGEISQKDFLSLYYQHWLHSEQEVGIEGGKATVKELDKHGYLLVKMLETGEMKSVFPDGNSFDMMSNLIIPKM